MIKRIVKILVFEKNGGFKKKKENSFLMRNYTVQSG